VREPVEVALRQMESNVDDVVRVSDDQIVDAMRMLLDDAGLVTEPAGAAGLAGAAKLRSELAGGRVGVIVTGGNISGDDLRRLLL
jgi:threonine dehydratase